MTITGKPADLSVDELGQGITESLDSLRAMAGEKNDPDAYHIVNRATSLLEELAGRADEPTSAPKEVTGVTKESIRAIVFDLFRREFGDYHANPFASKVADELFEICLSSPTPETQKQETR